MSQDQVNENEDQVEENVEGEEQLDRDTFYQLDLDGSVAVKNKETAIKDMVDKMGISPAEAEKMFEDMVIKFIGERLDIGFAKDKEGVLSVIRQIKEIAEDIIHEQQWAAPEHVHQIRALCNKVYKD